jgi:hypothetical protein
MATFYELYKYMKHQRGTFDVILISARNVSGPQKSNYSVKNVYKNGLEIETFI